QRGFAWRLKATTRPKAGRRRSLGTHRLIGPHWARIGGLRLRANLTPVLCKPGSAAPSTGTVLTPRRLAKPVMEEMAQAYAARFIAPCDPTLSSSSLPLLRARTVVTAARLIG